MERNTKALARKPAKWGLYAESRMRSQVIVWAVEPCPNLAHWMIQAFAATAQIYGLDEVTVEYAVRRIKDGVIQPLDLV